MALQLLQTISVGKGIFAKVTGLSPQPVDVIVRIPGLANGVIRPSGYLVQFFEDDFGAGLEVFWIRSEPLVSRVHYVVNGDRNDLGFYVPLHSAVSTPIDFELWTYV